MEKFYLESGKAISGWENQEWNWKGKVLEQNGYWILMGLGVVKIDLMTNVWS